MYHASEDQYCNMLVFTATHICLYGTQLALPYNLYLRLMVLLVRFLMGAWHSYSNRLICPTSMSILPAELCRQQRSGLLHLFDPILNRHCLCILDIDVPS